MYRPSLVARSWRWRGVARGAPDPWSRGEGATRPGGRRPAGGRRARGGRLSGLLLAGVLALSACGGLPRRAAAPAETPSTAPVASTSTSSTSTSSTSLPYSARPLVFLLTKSALGEVTADAQAAAVLRRSQVYELLDAGAAPARSLPDVVPTADFRSEASLAAALGAGGPSGRRAVLLDLEDWSFTPRAEQEDPARYLALAGAAARRAGVTLIAAPAIDLARVLAPGKGPFWRSYLRLGLAAAAARAAPVVEIQAQSLEGTPSLYAEFVAAAARQARVANPSVVVLAGLSTNDAGRPASLGDIEAAIAATRSIVAGYWMNIPSPGPACPACRPGSPRVAAEAIAHLG